MKRLYSLIMLFIINTVIFSSPRENVLETKLIENFVKREFKDDYSKILIAGKVLNLDMEINLLEEDGIIKIIAKDSVCDYKEKIGLIPKNFENYFDDLAEMVKNQIKTQQYKLNLIFVLDKGNKLITKKSYLM